MMNDEIRVAPSVLSADFRRLADELADVSTADLLHYDVMDGHFVPNLSFGIDLLRTVKSATELPVDVHLMITNPDEMVERYLDAGADVVSFHYEATSHAHRLVSLIKDRGAKASVAINPATPVCMLEPILCDLDMVLVMTVNPGFGGQRFIESSLRKLRRLRRMCDEQGVNPAIEVDGGITARNAAEVAAAGANVLVAGSSVFGAADRAAAIAAIRTSGTSGTSRRA
ncbi:ribulose-phosphate 3-epimerase [Thermophilibacter provencensis]|uniref:ribulose-phosphate 3-epimerase n=1 Tax=Thermophilibacter provencensis TaxID=1852386 RepID=UPI002943E9FC|nr:ribulose-phosphate 3-epimerase [Thermophilibacter provencensis]